MGTYDTTILIGTDESPRRVVDVVADALSAPAVEDTVSPGLNTYALVATEHEWVLATLDTEPLRLDSPDVASEYRDVRYELSVATAATKAESARIAKSVYEKLAADTPWKLALLDGEWGSTIDVREQLTHAS